MAVSFDVSRRDADLIRAIVNRSTKAHRAMGRTVTHEHRLHLQMNLTATHANGCPLDLVRLRDAEDFTFWHDLSGIDRHLDRETGRLLNFFRPRTALPQAEAA